MYKSADDDGDVMACAKCADRVAKDHAFCETCGVALEWDQDRARATTPTVPSRQQDASHLKDGDDDDVAKAVDLEKRLHHEGVGRAHNAVRANAAAEYERHRLSVLALPVEKRDDAAQALKRLADATARDLKVDHATAYRMIERSEAGRLLLKRAALEGRARAATV